MVLNYILILAYVATSVAGLLIIKNYMNVAQITNVFAQFSKMLSFQMLIGCALFIVSFVIYFIILAKMDLSFLVPIITGLYYVAMIVMSFLVLHEKINTAEIIGIVLVLVGVVLITLNTKS